MSRFEKFSVQSLCPLCLCGELIPTTTHHRDTEDTEDSQRVERLLPFESER